MRAALIVVLLAGASLPFTGGMRIGAQAPGPCDPPLGNPITCENALTGNLRSEWDISGSGDSSIQGFATDISVNRGQTVSFKIDTDATAYRLDIYRMGYYGGSGARKVTTVTPSVTLPQNQPTCISDALTGLIDCGNWAVSASWAVPATAVSGIYFAKVIRTDSGGASHIVFIVRDDASQSGLLFQTSDTTWQAYNQYGGNSLYVGGPGTNPGRAYKVSYNRPFTTRGTSPEDWVFNAEYPMVRWLEANGYDVSYFTGVDADRRGENIQQHKVFLSVGHDEYWSGAQRTKVEAARAAGVHLAFFSGNEVFWKTRWENSIALPATTYRTLVSYKETHANGKIDPTAAWTGTWRDPRFSPPADGGRPENALTGTVFTVNCCTTAITVPAADGKMRFWRGTSIAGLTPNTSATLPDGTLGYEWDSDLDNGFRPAGLFRMSNTLSSQPSVLTDFGSTYEAGTSEHALTLYRHASGALVFGAGTVQWSWGLDGNHDRGGEAPSVPMQQATINLFADMGVQPLTVQAGLAPAVASTDTIRPTSTITSPVHNAGVPANTFVTITGTATDGGGGVVGGVEVSVDGGATWRRAAGRGTWTYAWQTGPARTVSIFSRAVDDSGNLEQPVTGISVTVGVGSVTCPCSLWVPSQVPTGAPDSDPNQVELGTRFRSNISGYVTAIRFYKDPQNTGTHVGSLWTSTGTRLSNVTFTGESASGWQQATLPAPVQITAGTMYTVSYNTNSGFYAGTVNYFTPASVDNGPLHAPQDGTEGGGNGVYRYGSSAFPSQTFSGANYWVDVVFATSVGPDTTPPEVNGTAPASGSSSASSNTAVTATFNEDVTNVSNATFELTSGGVIPATVTYAASTRTATLTPNSLLAYSTTYTARLRSGASGIKDTAGNPLAVDYVWSFTTSAPPPPPPNEGPGGPILVIGSGGDPFSRYYAEILRAEGLNAFTATDISLVTSTMLTGYDVVVLGAIPLTSAQVTMLSDWVSAGGNLIAMRPDKKLASLLGLTDAAATVSEGYLLVNNAAGPGAGIVGQTMQFHGVADRYSLNGAASVATLYTTAAAATTNPAVTLRSVGAVGGQAAAFTFDLARSVVLTRQGNPAWSGQDRDGLAPIRSDDLFFGGAQPDWVDLNKVAIPQADEQQRLLANLVLHMNSDRRLLPRFWYFPRGEKAVVVMTGDDHAANGTPGRFDIYKGNSPANCNVNDWECIRATSYIYPTTPISNAQASAYAAEGFEIAVHITTNCGNYTPSSLQTNYANDLGAFATLFPGVPVPRTNRTHCIAWSDFDTQPQVALTNGIRLDTNYYYWPGAWVQDRPGFMTGSGMPMRFTKADGTMIDVYQAATQMTDESDQTWPFTIDTLLDRAIGPEGYYGFFTANMHTDFVEHVGSEAIVASAVARSVPVISAKQLLTWLDGRNGSSFSNISWNGTTMGFSAVVGAGANGLEGMIPAAAGTKTLLGLTRSGTNVSYRIETIKGMTYAIFPAGAGPYLANYGVDTTAPVITGVAAAPSTASASVTWATNEASDSRVDYGTSPATLTLSASSSALTSSHAMLLQGLNSSTTYYYRVTSADASGNAATSPASPAAPATFTTLTPPSLNCPCTIWPSTEVPNVVTQPDSGEVELGVKFRSSVSGFITGIRFYKGPQNVGVHTGTLWSSTGTLLSTITFTGETASGWQTASFTQPVAVTANTVYVASYHAPNGFYSADSGYFGTATISGPLEALANGTAGGNGVYRYGTSAFPTETFASSNYWVDLVFATGESAATSSLSVNDVSVNEGDAGTALATFTVTLSPPSSQTVTVNYATANATATAPADYITTSGPLEFTPGTATHTVTVPVVGDTSAEPNETFQVNLSAAVNATLADAQGTGTIVDNDLTSITIGDVTVTESNTTQNAVFAVSLSFASTQPVSVQYATVDGTAVAPTDYTARSGTLTIPAGSTTGQITVSIVGDTRDESGESFSVSLSAPVNATIAGATGTATIVDDDPIPSMVINNVSVPEGDSGTVAAAFIVKLSAASGQIVTVNYATANVTATAPSDYTAVTGTLTFAPGATTQQITVLVNGDTLEEAKETYQVNLSAPTNAIITDNLGIGTIVDNDPPTISIGNRTVTEGNAGTVNAAFTVTLSFAHALPVSVNYATSDGTAVGPADYAPAAGTLTIPAGATSGVINVPVVGDAIDEANETFTVTLSSPVNATIANGSGLGTITDNDATPTLAVNDVSLTEGDAGTLTATFTVSLSAVSGRPVTVNRSTANTTATAPADYTALATSTLTFPPGTTTQEVSVTVAGDLLDEADETFQVRLASAVNATIADATGVGTIVDNDATPTAVIDDISVTEQNTGRRTLTFTVTLSAASSRTVSISYATADNTAIAPGDYTARTGTLTFAAGVTTRPIAVDSIGDTTVEPSETFFVNLINGVNVTIADAQGTGTILNND